MAAQGPGWWFAVIFDRNTLFLQGEEGARPSGAGRRGDTQRGGQARCRGVQTNDVVFVNMHEERPLNSSSQ